MSQNRRPAAEGNGSGDGEEECQRLYAMLRSRPITPSALMQVRSAHSSSDDEAPAPRHPATSARNANKGRHAKHTIPEEGSSDDGQRNADDGCIKIHSLSSDATITVPETHQKPPETPRKDNLTRQRTALTLPTPRSRPQTANNGPPDSRPSTATSLRSRRDPLDSARSSMMDSRHAVVRPGADSSYSHSNAPNSPFSTGSSRPFTMTRELLHRSGTQKDKEKVKILRKLFIQAHNEEDDDEEAYNEWREGMNDRNDVRELSEELYFKEDGQHGDTPIYKYNLFLGRMVELLDQYALLPVPPGFIVKCRITRSRKGIDGRIFPHYFLHLQRSNGPDVLLMSARKNRTLSTSYVISADPADLSAKSPNCLGRVDANLRGSEFSLMTPVEPDPNEASVDSGSITGSLSSNKDKDKKREWQQLLAVEYESNTLGYKGPRKMGITIPKMKSDYERTQPGSFKEKDNDLLIKLKNRDPHWSSETSSFILNFHGRVDVASVKNFQIHHPDLTHNYLMQFGRMFKEDNFILDLSYPFCPLQAFAIALTSFDVKWGLE